MTITFAPTGSTSASQDKSVKLVTPGPMNPCGTRPQSRRCEIAAPDEERDLARRATSADTSSVHYEIDGNEFETLEGFFAEISRVLIPGASWGRDLDAFNDVLWGGFGTPSEGFTLRWKNHDVSRGRLGYSETLRQLESRAAYCHPSNSAQVRGDLERARSHIGPTAFDWLLEILCSHRPNQANPSGNVTSELC